MSKPSRFILNTDFITTHNDMSGTVNLTLPSTVNATNDRSYEATIDIGTDTASGYRFYITSSKFPGYAICAPEFNFKCKQDGGDTSVGGSVYRQGKSFVFEVIFPGTGGQGSTTYTDCGQTLTLHIQSFIDPFQS